MTEPDIVHGSVDGYRSGCRSRGGCQHHGSAEYVTCADAAILARSDIILSRLPSHQPIPRNRPQTAAVPSRLPSPETVEPRHGTMRGYRRGCHRDRECPHWRQGRLTCAEARRRYVTDYRARRTSGDGAAIVHGTSRGYLTGCRDRERCPGDDSGLSCPDARNHHKLAVARAAGTPPRQDSVDAAAATQRVRAWQQDGISLRTIARLTGVGRSTIGILAAGARGHSALRVSAATLARVTATQIDPQDPDKGMCLT